MEDLQKCKKEIIRYISAAGDSLTEDLKDPDEKRIAELMFLRQRDWVKLLDCVRAETEVPYIKPGGKNIKSIIKETVTGDLIKMILSISSVLFGALLIIDASSGTPGNFSGRWGYGLMISLVVLLGLCIYSMLIRSKEQNEILSQPSPAAYAVIDEERAKALIRKLTAKLPGDAKDVCSVFAGQQSGSSHIFRNDLIRMYTSLYEAHVDNPGITDFNYALGIAELMLHRTGLKAVPYSDADQHLFDIEEEDYRDEMRYPAIVSEDSGAVVKRGEYIRNTGIRRADRKAASAL
ncbi:MAG: hypothetical protein Q4G47_03225 [Lachnospiraceae bacterium]|nr:hypothetical protein [Lachnospiraceae bacterium]